MVNIEKTGYTLDFLSTITGSLGYINGTATGVIGSYIAVNFTKDVEFHGLSIGITPENANIVYKTQLAVLQIDVNTATNILNNQLLSSFIDNGNNVVQSNTGKSGKFELVHNLVNPVKLKANTRYLVGVLVNSQNVNFTMTTYGPKQTFNGLHSELIPDIKYGDVIKPSPHALYYISDGVINGRRQDELTHMLINYGTNNPPTVSLTSPSNNQTLYENDTLTIDGTVRDTDNGNTVTVRYQIGAGTVRAIKAFVSTGTIESFNKQLRFSGGNLYDGDTLIASNLTDGAAHTLKVWATDDQGGTSTIIERTFYVVPNRAPSLSVNTPVISGNIDNDEVEITGSYNDLDKNTTKVAYRINGGGSVQVAEGTGGDFNFKVKFGQLKVGLNSIVVEAIDSYGAKTSRTVKLNKNEVKTEQLKSTARFKIHPPLNTATGIVLWVRRDENLTLSASISMTQAAEAENFVQMENPRTAPLANTHGVVEDQFEYESASPAEKIILQLDMQRSSLTANEKIYLLVGVID